LALCARRVSSAASRLLGTTSLRFALHGWQQWTTLAGCHTGWCYGYWLNSGREIAHSPMQVTAAVHPLPDARWRGINIRVLYSNALSSPDPGIAVAGSTHPLHL
ncbi:hypothetical protein, partial [Thiolapillus sp.]|uniref:hypothetical protein n=1 Tax=Thiolapillus sp. TaxID=2017437 RepID=UPI003AF4226A